MCVRERISIQTCLANGTALHVMWLRDVLGGGSSCHDGGGIRRGDLGLVIAGIGVGAEGSPVV